MSDTMRVLTVRQPWAAAIVYLGKDVENRTRNVSRAYRGPVAIHTSARKRDDLAYINGALNSPYFDTTVLRERYDHAPQDPWWGAIGDPLGIPLLSGAVIGVVDLVDVHHASDTACLICADGCCGCSPWAMPDCYHLELANPRPLLRPIPAKGRLGLWHPGADLEAAIWEQVAA